MSDKAEQRKMGVSFRNALDKKLAAQYSETISGKLINSKYFDYSQTILSYQPFRGEVDILRFNEFALHSGKTMAYPICGSNGNMVAAAPLDQNSWEEGKYGIRTPIRKASQILAPENIDLVIVPCIAFDRKNRMRIGMGAGYYDRYLPKCINAWSIAVAYDVQQVEDICYDKWDVALNAIVTENNWY